MTQAEFILKFLIMKQTSYLIINPFSGVPIIAGNKYWYPTVRYCCHFSQTYVKSFTFDPSVSGHVDFVMNQPVYATEADAKVQANSIRNIFGLPQLH